MSHETDHADRSGLDTRYIETCWRCAEDWLAYANRHSEDVAPGAYVLAMPKEDAADFDLGGEA